MKAFKIHSQLIWNCTCCFCLKVKGSAQLHLSTSALAVLVSKQQVQHSCTCQQVHLLFLSLICCSHLKATGSAQLHLSTSALAVPISKQQVQQLHLFSFQSNRLNTVAPINKCTCCFCLKATGSAQLHLSTSALAILVLKQQAQHICTCQQVQRGNSTQHTLHGTITKDNSSETPIVTITWHVSIQAGQVKPTRVI